MKTITYLSLFLVSMAWGENWVTTEDRNIDNSIFISTENTAGLLVVGRCSVCMKENKESTVTCEAGFNCTAMYCGSGYYDKDGTFIPPPNCNTCTQTCRCSNGHVITDGFKK